MTYEELKANIDGRYFTLSEKMIESLKVYARLLKEWNEKINLTSIVEEEEVIEKHFYDSLLPTKEFDFNNKSIADMGTGAGFPGLMLAIAFPSAKVTLIDATAKKFKFLNAVIEELGIKNVILKQGRVEEMKKDREKYDVVTSRGFSALTTIVEVGSPLVKMGGTLLAMKAAKANEEMMEAGKAIDIMGLKLSFVQKDKLPSGDARNNIFFKKVEHTQRKFPRSWAEIVSKPL